MIVQASIPRRFLMCWEVGTTFQQMASLYMIIFEKII